jgi:hypothetical protein
LVRPFTLGRLADVIRLTRVFQGITSDHVEEAMMVTRDRAVELLKQAEEMRLIKPDGFLYYSTSLGNAFFEALKNDDRMRLDDVLSGYAPYNTIKNILSRRSANIAELKKMTGLTEVATEIVLRLLQYVHDDFCSVNEEFFLRAKELPNLAEFLSSTRRAYQELNNYTQWGCSKDFVRLDKIAGYVCQELRLSADDFSRLLNEALKSSSFLEVHSEVVGYQFLPFAPRKLNSTSYRRCYIRLRE